MLQSSQCNNLWSAKVLSSVLFLSTFTSTWVAFVLVLLLKYINSVLLPAPHVDCVSRVQSRARSRCSRTSTTPTPTLAASRHRWTPTGGVVRSSPGVGGRGERGGRRGAPTCRTAASRWAGSRAGRRWRRRCRRRRRWPPPAPSASTPARARGGSGDGTASAAPPASPWRHTRREGAPWGPRVTARRAPRVHSRRRSFPRHENGHPCRRRRRRRRTGTPRRPEWDIATGERSRRRTDSARRRARLPRQDRKHEATRPVPYIPQLAGRERHRLPWEGIAGGRLRTARGRRASRPLESTTRPGERIRWKRHSIPRRSTWQP